MYDPQTMSVFMRQVLGAMGQYGYEPDATTVAGPMAKPQNQQQLGDLAVANAGLPQTPDSGPLLPPEMSGPSVKISITPPKPQAQGGQMRQQPAGA